MAFATLNGHRCYYRREGSDTRPVLVLSHSLGLDHTMWDPQVPDLLPHVQVVRYDVRGHGASDAPAGDYTIADLARDALALADHLSIERFAFCGVSLGGMIGQWLGRHAPDRLTSLVLANTTARVADPAAMEARRQTVLAGGMPAVVDASMTRFFGPELAAAAPPAMASARRTFLATAPAGYAGCCAALRDMDQRADLAAIRVPTLVVGGDGDDSMPWDAHGARLASAIPDARVVRLPGAHISNLVRPRAFTDALLTHLVERPADVFDAGLAVRRAVLGDAHVDRALAGATDLTRDFQHFITTSVWGSVWTRPGLDRRTRRLLVLVITAALGRWEEFRLHLRTGLDHELEWCDVREALIQTAAYAGVPAANTAFHIASEERDARGAGA
jgi:3-oxoadipate enol-lactonase/4-carboxymuconolactone decarboxylase